MTSMAVACLSLSGTPRAVIIAAIASSGVLIICCIIRLASCLPPFLLLAAVASSSSCSNMALPQIVVHYESVSELRSPRAERSQASQKESDRSNLDQGFAAGRQALIIASQTPVPDQPAQSAFHFPSVPLDLEASREANQFAIDDGPWVRFGHNFGVPTQMHFDPGNERPSIAAVSEQMRKARETASQLLQEQGSTSTIDEPSRMNLDGEQQSEGINQNMPLATIDFFFRHQSRVRCLAPDWS